MKKKLYFCTLLWNNVTMLKRIYILILSVCIQLSMYAATVVRINDPTTWRNTELSQYRGQTIEFNVPFYVCNNYNSSSLTISPRRIFQATNQAIPLSNEYNSLLTNNSYGTITLTGVSGYHRMGEMLYKLVVKVNSNTSVSLVSCDFVGNTRADMEKGYDSLAVNMRGKADVIVCCMNLEYYLVETWGDKSMGPKDPAAHQKQRTKVSQALAKINADLYGFVEIEQGQSALAEIAADLTKNTGRVFRYINDGGSAKGTYTKAGFVYCSNVLEPYGKLKENNTGVSERKKTQAFIEKETGEKFLFSVNHFKAKSSGSGLNADQGDGQGGYNYARVQEANSLLSNYGIDKDYYGDKDILIMGDLNAYAMEDPITVLKEGGMIDLHRAFHADSSYSYVYRGYAGYLDHALCNSTLYPQVTGMVAYHINSDESDSYTYDKSNDQTMFRCSDHDPVIVGLRLDQSAIYNPNVNLNSYEVYYEGETPCIRNAKDGWYRIYRVDGNLVKEAKIESNEQSIEDLSQGIYILNIYGQSKCLQTKILIP